MIRLIVSQAAIPRTTTRQQWRELERGRRMMERVIRAEIEQQSPEIERRFDNLALFGTSHPEIFL